MSRQEDIGKHTNYLIHTIPSRVWYVTEYLIPSMVLQGINRRDITVYNDLKGQGNLLAFVNSSRKLTRGTWHLQDDVIIASNFKEVTEKMQDSKVVCGFCSDYSENEPAGEVASPNMWYSFPCIYIPYSIMQEFLRWLDIDALRNDKYRNWINAGKFDDSLFMEFMKSEHLGGPVINLKPNLVDHVDFLLGGSTLNKQRTKSARSIYWDEPELIDKLSIQLSGR